MALACPVGDSNLAVQNILPRRCGPTWIGGVCVVNLAVQAICCAAIGKG